jgi:hypothetical protein
MVYTVKASEVITHVKQFKGTKTLIRDFGFIADLLGPLMGCFLISAAAELSLFAGPFAGYFRSAGSCAAQRDRVSPCQWVERRGLRRISQGRQWDGKSSDQEHGHQNGSGQGTGETEIDRKAGSPVAQSDRRVSGNETLPRLLLIIEQ